MVQSSGQVLTKRTGLGYAPDPISANLRRTIHTGERTSAKLPLLAEFALFSPEMTASLGLLGVEGVNVMKTVSQSMSPREAAQAFYGQDEAAFELVIGKLSESDPRLVKVFQQTRKTYLDGRDS